MGRKGNGLSREIGTSDDEIVYSMVIEARGGRDEEKAGLRSNTMMRRENVRKSK